MPFRLRPVSLPSVYFFKKAKTSPRLLLGGISLILAAVLSLVQFSQSAVFARSHQPGESAQLSVKTHAMRTYQSSILGVTRTFQVYVPASASASEPLPAVLAYHGYRMDGTAMAQMTNFNALAETEHFIAIYPLGLNRGWNGRAVANHLTTDIDFTKDILRQLPQINPVDTTRIYAAGFSNGGFLVHRLACEMPERFAAFAAVSSTIGIPLSEDCNPVSPRPMLMINGSTDPIVTWDGHIRRIGIFFRSSKILSVPKTVAFWQQRLRARPIEGGERIGPVNTSGDLRQPSFLHPNRLSAQAQDYESPAQDGSQGTTITSLRQWTVNGGGHTWPGDARQNALTRILVGRDYEQMNASEIIWHFFQQNPLPTHP